MLTEFGQGTGELNSGRKYRAVTETTAMRL